MLRNVTLTNYRNYSYTRFHIDQPWIIVTGANGVGKTNLLEAISLLTPGRGLRGAKTEDLRRRDSHHVGWGVVGEIESAQGKVKLATGIDKAGQTRRSVLIDDKESPQSLLARYSAILWCTPQTERVFEGSTSRRQFLDHFVSLLFPAHLREVSRYKRLLRERMLLLLQGNYDPDWMNSLERQIACNSVGIAQARLNVIQYLNQACQESRTCFGHFRLTMSDSIEGALLSGSAEEIEADVRRQFASLRRQDARTGVTAVGSHRSDVSIFFQTPALKSITLCSTGEQKSILLALILTHAKLIARIRSLSPILLFDEISAYLDQERRALLFEELRFLDTQVWLTGNDERIFTDFSGQEIKLASERLPYLAHQEEGTQT